MLLTPPAKTILKRLRELTGYTEETFTRYRDTPVFFLMSDPDKKADCSDYDGEILTVLSLLEAEGFIDFYDNGATARLTQKAIHREYAQWAEIKEFLFRSIFTPIAVSAITTIVTLWITTLLQ